VRIIDKGGGRSPIPADRDHCLQYMGRRLPPDFSGALTAADYEDTGSPPMRASMRCAPGLQVRENPTFTAGVLRPRQALQSAMPCRCFFPRRAAAARAVQVGLPGFGHRKRRGPRACRCWSVSSPLQWNAHFRTQGRPSASRRCSPRPAQLDALPVNELMAALGDQRLGRLGPGSGIL